ARDPDPQAAPTDRERFDGVARARGLTAVRKEAAMEPTTTSTTARRAPASRLAWEAGSAGALGGILAGIAMAVFLMAYAGVTGAGVGLPVRLIAATPYGVDALVRSPGMLLVGVLIHVAVSAFWGLLFAL